jgi:L,D-peptidoglycan transpeptidase YkuD (ErfK/YbiS/YcfS/YnhG family)
MANTITVTAKGALTFQGKTYPCALGKTGVKADKREGDSATPVGCFPLLQVFFRADRLAQHVTGLPVVTLAEDDGWCDESADQRYNTYVKLPCPVSHERLWRDDEVYDVIVVVGYNNAPPVPGLGSAIFLHVARPSLTPTAGCVALALPDLLEVLASATADTQLCIEPA